MIVESKYQHVPWLTNGHLETVVPSAFRSVKNVLYRRQRLELADGDFLDLDWLRHDDVDTKKLIIISHGLEGSSDRHYVRGMAKYFYNRGWDALAWNCRSCSGELNRLARFYHHGDTDDLQFVIDEAWRKGYTHVSLTGFSMGGSFTTKYIGERGSKLDPRIKGGAAFSVPCKLASSAAILDEPYSRFYRNRFLTKLGKKILAKSLIYPDILSHKDYHKVITLRQFDDRYTSPLHGFKNATDFYSRVSSDQFLPDVKVPLLIVNAANDPFLAPECFPTDVAKDHKFFTLEIPKRGGHVGFSLPGKEENYMEARAFEFLNF